MTNFLRYFVIIYTSMRITFALLFTFEFLFFSVPYCEESLLAALLCFICCILFTMSLKSTPNRRCDNSFLRW